MRKDSSSRPVHLTRRQFHRSAAALGAAAFWPASSALAAEDDSRIGPFIDFHTHLSQTHTVQRGLSAEEMIDWMDEHNVAKAVVLPLISPKSWGFPLTPDHVLAMTEAHRDRLIPFCSVDPRSTFNRHSGSMIEVIRRYKEAGARGFGEHKVGLAIDDPRNMKLYEACTEVGLPVLFHLDNVRNFDEPGLPGLEKVLKAFPENNFIGHAQGWWASISGDVKKEQMQHYPGGKITQRGAIDRLMDRYDNIYGDLSAGSGANAISRDREFGRAFLIRRADRLVFGTDKLMPEQKVRQFKLYASLDLPKDVQSRIFRENARRLLDLK